MALKEYKPGTAFPGKIGRTVADSSPAWPAPLRTKAGAPNVTVPIIFGIEGLSCGYDFGEAVTHDYHTPFRFTGTLHKVTVDLSGDLIKYDESAMRTLMSRQ